jgi:expansin (peptidoglycan-binding protein)
MRRRELVLVLSTLVGACGGAGADGGDDGPVNPPPASCDDPPATYGGEGTYYDADGSGNCSFDPSPGNLMVAAMNITDYAGSAVCGACVAIDGPDGSVTVRIVDSCPGCAPGDLDLSPQAFERIAPLAAGRVPITWHYVPCDVTGPVRYRFKDGANQWWTALQVLDHRHAVESLEVQRDDGSWRAVERLSYNYFVADDGLGPGPYTIRITDVLGQELVDQGVPLGDATTVTGAAQFPACP